MKIIWFKLYEYQWLTSGRFADDFIGSDILSALEQRTHRPDHEAGNVNKKSVYWNQYKKFKQS